MSKLTARHHSSQFSLESFNAERESLGSQLDRLNQAIQSITHEQISPVLPLNCGLSSPESFTDFSKVSYCEVDESFEIEKFSPELERLQMIAEDFRSHEERKSSKSPSSNKLILEICLKDLDKLIDDIETLKNSDEFRSSDNIINVAGKQIIFMIKDFSGIFPNKSVLRNGFRSLSLKLKPNDEKNRKNDRFQNELEELMAKSYVDSFEGSGNCPNVQHYNKITACEIYRISKQKNEHQKILQKLELQSAEIAMMKEMYQRKLRKLQECEKLINSKKVEIKTEEARVQSQKLILAKDIEIIMEQRKIVEQAREDNRKKLEIVKNTLSEIKKNANCIIKPLQIEKPLIEKKKSDESIVLKPRRNEQKYEIDFEIQLLQQEIQALEAALKSDPKGTESIKTKLDRLKTKESNLKSKRVINASLERSNSMNSKMNFFEKERTLSSLIESQSRPDLHVEPLMNSNKMNQNSKKPPINSPKKIIEKPAETQDQQHKYLKLREIRLIEKEEELNKRENMLINNWNKSPDDLGLMAIVQNEQRNLKILRKDLEKRQKNLEQEVLAHSRRCSEMKVKEREVLNALESFDVFIYQKKHIEGKLQFLLSVFEDISKKGDFNV